MKPEILHLPPVFLAGAGFFGNPFTSHAAWTEENEIGLLWNRYFSLMTEAGFSYPGGQAASSEAKAEGDGEADGANLRAGECAGASGAAMPGEFYELHILHPQSLKTGDYEVFVGHQVPLEDPVRWDIRFSTKVLPGGDYAVFWLAGEAMTDDWTRDLELPEGYRVDTGFSVNKYDYRFKGMDRLSESEIQVYAPLRRD
ncbi:GyrI-like domain-containing protein [Spirochaeta lutea]|uniref:Uncharacterized protein n=1 Tax=Spirochaeta lutea TaxID=1480694 RepID=A0A098QY98_9SPIO|nr:GyrI-like domain-containing protein [Spirochaeta lutea]KGE72669.1 hypothetical protein DC28_06350 [Spirochaeta lutea]